MKLKKKTPSNPLKNNFLKKDNLKQGCLSFLFTMIKTLKKFLLSIFYLAFPHHCHLCDKKILDERQICPECILKIPPFLLKEIHRPDNIQVYLEKIYSGWDYTPEIQTLIEKIKFKKKLKLLKTLLDLCDFKIQDKIDIVSFVPLSFHGFVERGFNQAKVIAQRVSSQNKLSLAGLLRKHPRIKQSWKNREERLKMIHQSPFILKKQNKLEGKSILLIDDILTTGATLASIAALLKSQGAAIFALTLIHVEKQDIFESPSGESLS